MKTLQDYNLYDTKTGTTYIFRGPFRAIRAAEKRAELIANGTPAHKIKGSVWHRGLK